jgi:integrase
VTFERYAEQWRGIQVHRPNTARQIESNLRNHIYPRIGNRPIGAIRPSEIQALVKGLDGTLKPSTIEVVYAWVTAVFNAALADQVIARTPCRDIKRPEVPPKIIEPISVETVEALVDSVPGPYRAVQLLGASTGVRAGEALGITSDRVDWARRFVTVDRQLLDVRAGVPIFGPVKDNESRAIPLPDTVLAALVEHVRVFGLGPEGLLFTNSENRPIRRAGFGEMWRRPAGPLGIGLGDGFHSCGISTPASSSELVRTSRSWRSAWATRLRSFWPRTPVSGPAMMTALGRRSTESSVLACRSSVTRLPPAAKTSRSERQTGSFGDYSSYMTGEVVSVSSQHP